MGISIQSGRSEKAPLGPSLQEEAPFHVEAGTVTDVAQNSGRVETQAGRPRCLWPLSGSSLAETLPQLSGWVPWLELGGGGQGRAEGAHPAANSSKGFTCTSLMLHADSVDHLGQTPMAQRSALAQSFLKNTFPLKLKTPGSIVTNQGRERQTLKTPRFFLCCNKLKLQI